MLGVNLAVFVLVGQLSVSPPSSDVTSLINQLGSGRFVERQSAANSLERYGKQALPALKTARNSKDPEVRTRALSLITKIEGALLTQPSLVRLDYQDRPLVEVIEHVGNQAGVRLVLYPEQAPGIEEKRITLREAPPLPFWKALDRLCDTAQLQYNFVGIHSNGNSREPVFPLFLNGNRPTGPMSDDGPFRVSLISLHYERDVSFTAGNANQAIPRIRNDQARAVAPPADARPQYALNEQFFAQLQVAAEPRLSVSQSAPIRILEAIDDQGQSLLPAEARDNVIQRYSGFFGLSPAATIHVQATLQRPENPGRSIRRLRGVLPVVVASRRPDPLVIPLQNATGKSYSNEEVSLTVLDVKMNPNSRQTSIELSLRSSVSRVSGPTGVENPGDELITQRMPSNQQQIEVLDSQGRSIPWYHSNDAEGAKMTLTLIPHEQGAPSEIRYFSMSKAATEVHFVFENIPLP